MTTGAGAGDRRARPRARTGNGSGGGGGGGGGSAICPPIEKNMICDLRSVEVEEGWRLLDLNPMVQNNSCVETV